MKLLIKQLLSLAFISSTFFVHGQNDKTIDSLKNVIHSFEKQTRKIALKDTNAVYAYLELSTYILNNNPDSSFSLKLKAKSLAEELAKNMKKNNPSMKSLKNIIATSTLGFGLYYELKGDRDKAIESYKKALAIFEEINYKSEVSKVLNNISIINFRTGKVSEAMEFFERNLVVLGQLGNKQGLAVTMNNMAFIYYNQGNITLALDYYTKSMKILEEIGDSKSLATLLNSIAGVYSNQGDYEKTIEYINKSLQIFEKINDKSGIAFCYNNLGSTYEKYGKVKEAEDYYNHSLKLRIELEDKTGISVCYNNIAGLKLNLAKKLKSENKQKEFETLVAEAEELYYKSMVLKKELNDKIGLANVYINLANIGDVNNNLIGKSGYINEAYMITKSWDFLPKFRSRRF
jgi:tetratricopeptide (TPR) repeat protein